MSGNKLRSAFTRWENQREDHLLPGLIGQSTKGLVWTPGLQKKKKIEVPRDDID